MSKPKPYILTVIDAICESTLPADLRHLLIVMAYKADNDTGRGITGQDTLGRLVGCGTREVRRKLDRLEALSDAPVRVVRRYRSRSDGRGRTSDEYQLELTNRTCTSASTVPPTGRPRPLERSDLGDDQPDVHDTPTGRPRPDQPDAHVLGSTQGSTQKDLRSSFVAPKGTTRSSADSSKRGSEKRRAKASKPKTKPQQPKPDRTPEQQQAHAVVTAHYFAEFDRLRGTKPIGWGAKEGKAVHTLLEKLKYNTDDATRIITNGLTSWAQATIMDIAGNPSRYTTAPAKTRGRGPAVQPGDDYDFKQFEARNA